MDRHSRERAWGRGEPHSASAHIKLWRSKSGATHGLDQLRRINRSIFCSRSCATPDLTEDRAGRQPAEQAQGLGSAWFYCTSYDLSDPAQCSTPQEISGSWNEYETSGRPFFKGWYPTWMTPGLQPGHLSTTGHVFYLYGATGGGGGGRTYSSRTFVSRPADNSWSFRARDSPTSATQFFERCPCMATQQAEWPPA